jgi:hypothetical protein
MQWKLLLAEAKPDYLTLNLIVGSSVKPIPTCM